MNSPAPPPFSIGPCRRPNARTGMRLGAIAVSALVLIATAPLKNGPRSALGASSLENGSRAVMPSPECGDEGDLQQAFARWNKLVQDLRSTPDQMQAPLTQLRGNPFRQGPIIAASPQDGAQSLPDRQEAQRQAALKAVQSLRLGAISALDAKRSCRINDATYAEGQEVDGFVIEEVTSGAVLVRRGVYRFELKIGR